MHLISLGASSQVALDLAPQQLTALTALHANHLTSVASVSEQFQALCALHQRAQVADHQQAGCTSGEP